jgi:hypothetical protein
MIQEAEDQRSERVYRDLLGLPFPLPDSVNAPHGQEQVGAADVRGERAGGEGESDAALADAGGSGSGDAPPGGRDTPADEQTAQGEGQGGSSEGPEEMDLDEDERRQGILQELKQVKILLTALRGFAEGALRGFQPDTAASGMQVLSEVADAELRAQGADPSAAS